MGFSAVKKMELSLVYNPRDAVEFLGTGAEGYGYWCSGTSAGRNIELIYEKATAALSAGGRPPPSLETAVRACFDGPRRPRHVLLVSGFYVKHNLGARTEPGVVAGSCETDGPLGVLALLRAFAFQGVRVSLFADRHNGPVIREGYEAILRVFENVDPSLHSVLQQNSRCLEFLSDEVREDEDSEAFAKAFEQAFPGGAASSCQHRCRAVRLVLRLGAAVRAAWGAEAAAAVAPIDALFAIERLGAPYRNIRGVDISENTEPIDVLWPAVDPGAVGLSEGAREELGCFFEANPPEATRRLRSLAGVTEDALTLGIGDGGNEVGMGGVAHLEGVVERSPPGGSGEFVALAVNGCRRNCDHVLLATVSNWGGSAFEAAVYALVGPPTVGLDYAVALRRNGVSAAQLEASLLRAISAPPFLAVDGTRPGLEEAVDGMDFGRCHAPLYDLLWKLAGCP